MNVVKMRVFQVLKWFSIALGILTFIGMFSSDNYVEEITFFTAASFFVLLTIFFHLEQHKS